MMTITPTGHLVYVTPLALRDAHHHRKPKVTGYVVTGMVPSSPAGYPESNPLTIVSVDLPTTLRER